MHVIANQRISLTDKGGSAVLITAGVQAIPAEEIR